MKPLQEQDGAGEEHELAAEDDRGGGQERDQARVPLVDPRRVRQQDWCARAHATRAQMSSGSACVCACACACAQERGEGLGVSSVRTKDESKGVGQRPAGVEEKVELHGGQRCHPVRDAGAVDTPHGRAELAVGTDDKERQDRAHC